MRELSTPGVTHRWGRGGVRFSPTGRLDRVWHSADPELTYLNGLSPVAGTMNGQPAVTVPGEVQSDVDELEVDYVLESADPPTSEGPSPGPVQVVVRHTFVAGWAVRVVVRNPGEEAVRLVDLGLSIGSDTQVFGWGLAAGADASVSFHPRHGRGPVLGGLLRYGSVSRVNGAGLTFPELTLHSGERYVVQWDWRWCPTPVAFGRKLHPDIPSTAAYPVGESAEISADDDVALSVPVGVTVTTDRSGRRLVADLPVAGTVEVASARGVTSYGLEWVPPLTEALRTWAKGVLSGPRTRHGVLQLSHTPAAVVVQHALGQAVVDDPDDADDALQRFTAGLLERPRLGSAEIAFLCAEHSRTGSIEPLEQAHRQLLATLAEISLPPRAYGLGMAATAVCLALMVNGRDVAPVLRGMDAAAATLGDGQTYGSYRLTSDPTIAPPDAQFRAEAAAVELWAVSRQRRTDSPHSHDPQLVDRAGRLGLALGAGLKGGPLTPLSPLTLAQVIAALQLLPESVGAELTGRWGVSAGDLAHRAIPGLLSRLDRARVGAAHAILVLSRPPE